MSKIRIKNFGPIKEGYTENGGWMDVKKVTLFIGNQGSGKSTVAKLISTFMWMEKALNRGELKSVKGADFIKLIAWHQIGSYFREDGTEIEYRGDRFVISYKPTKETWPAVEDTIAPENPYLVPKIMYVSDQRNFLSTIKAAFDIAGLPPPLQALAQKFKKAQLELDHLKLPLPFTGFSYEYDGFNDTSYISGTGYKINLLEASSGLQSAIPLFLVSRNLSWQVDFENEPSSAPISANQSIRRDKEISLIMSDKSLTSEEKVRKTDEVFAKYHNKCFINIVEEPEQNLYPTSQKAMLDKLLEFNNMSPGNKLIMTTHSPYMINYLTLAVEANSLLQKIKDAGMEESLNELVYQIVPKDSDVSGKDIAIYEMDETTGTISLLGNYKGLPSDENKLNNELGMGNEFFAELLEIEQRIRI